MRRFPDFRNQDVPSANRRFAVVVDRSEKGGVPGRDGSRIRMENLISIREQGMRLPRSGESVTGVGVLTL